MKKLWKSEEFRELCTNVNRNTWNSSIERRFYLVKHPNSHPIEFTTKSGEIQRYRSNLEVKLAKYLDDHNIEFTYEEIEIDYMYHDNSYKYYPDFYLIKYNLILETHYENLIDDVMLAKADVVLNSTNYEFEFITESSDIEEVLSKYIRGDDDEHDI